MTARTLGVVGTLVWDRFLQPEGDEAVEEWGGIAYALAAFSASLPQGWSILPIVKVGGDLIDRAVAFISGIPRVDPSWIVQVEQQNNRVEIRYETESRRAERLTGGVPAWTREELSDAVAGCDALYVNFISGHELALDTAQQLSRSFAGPIYADLHSLFLDMDERGSRIPRPLPSAPEWLRCFDVVQMNEDELELLAGAGRGWRYAESALGDRPRSILVTLGERGSAAVSLAGDGSDPLQWARAGSRLEERTSADRIEVATERRTGDPTGCGDVWGAVTFARLLAGASVARAMAEGNRIGGLNVGHRGAEELARHLTAPGADVRAESVRKREVV